MSQEIKNVTDTQAGQSEVAQSRRFFLRRTTALAIAGGSAAMLLSSSSKSAFAKAPPKGPAAAEAYFRSVQKHERDHVAFLTKALGKAARPKPTFHRLGQATFADFALVAQLLENTGVGAYLGAAPKILNRDYLAAAGSIALIEARHAGYLNSYVGDPLTANASDDGVDNSFELPLTPDEVVAGASHFIKSLNGGPPVSYSNTPSADNDIAILNFALALEYLENEFYNINVRTFYGA